MTWGAIRTQTKTEETDRETWPGLGRVEFQQLTYCAGEASPEQPVIFGRAFEGPPFFTWSGVLRRNEPDSDEWPGGGVPVVRSYGEPIQELNNAIPVPLPNRWEPDDLILLITENNGNVVETDPDNPTGNYIAMADSADLGVAGIYYGDSTDWNLIGSQSSYLFGLSATTRLTAWWARAYEGMPQPIVSDPGATNHQGSFTVAYRGVDWINGPIASTSWDYEHNTDTTFTIPSVASTSPCGVVGIGSIGNDDVVTSATNTTLGDFTTIAQYQITNGTRGALLATYGGLPAGGSSGTTACVLDAAATDKVMLSFALLGKNAPDYWGDYGPGQGPWDLSNFTIGVKEWIRDDSGAYVGAYLWYKIDKLEEIPPT